MAAIFDRVDGVVGPNGHIFYKQNVKTCVCVCVKFHDSRTMFIVHQIWGWGIAPKSRRIIVDRELGLVEIVLVLQPGTT